MGNIANNAYLNARFLREAGVDCHVLSYDYYDVMATPEWEGATRPEWFVQGPFSICNRYLHALLDRRQFARAVRWRQLALARRFLAPVALDGRHSGWNRTALYVYVTTRRAGARVVGRFRRRRGSEPTTSGPVSPAAAQWTDPQSRLASDFARVFPNRRDQLQPADFDHWAFRPDEWVRLFERYDIVQCYATDPIRALIAGTRPYVAFEHGTLRDFTLGNDPVHRLNALAYRLADHVLITNGDCLDYAQRLGITRYTPMIHPVDVAQHERTTGTAAKLRARLDAALLLLCPLRHDWAIKGTDIHLRALPTIVERHGPGVRLVLCDWGAEVTRSRGLIEELGMDEHVVWLPPLDRPQLIEHMHAAAVVLDQMALPHFGATAPQALAAGRPVVMSYRPESTSWIVEEPAPILAAFDAPGVAAAVETALDPDWLRSYQTDARRWVDTYHHPRRVVREHCRIYRNILGDR